MPFVTPVAVIALHEANCSCHLASGFGEFAVLQGHGFLTVYNGSDLSYKISQLRRNTEYKFRVSTVHTALHSRYIT